MSLARHRELLVLGVLRDHEVHGYALVEALAGGLGRAVGLKRAAAYALLARLEERGLVKHVAKKDSAYPERRVYRITKQGRTAILEAARASASPAVQTTVPLALVIAFLDELPPEERVSVLESHRSKLEAALEELSDISDHEGNAGLSLRLLHDHVKVDLKAVRGLLSVTRRAASS